MPGASALADSPRPVPEPEPFAAFPFAPDVSEIALVSQATPDATPHSTIRMFAAMGNSAELDHTDAPTSVADPPHAVALDAYRSTTTSNLAASGTDHDLTTHMDDYAVALRDLAHMIDGTIDEASSASVRR